MEVKDKEVERIDELKKWENDNGITGYDILKIPGCPYNLPKARSMTQARNDYYHLLPTLIQWYLTQSPN